LTIPLQETVLVKNKIEDLISRVVKLEVHFAIRPGDVAEQRRRTELIRYVIIPLWAYYCSSPCSQLGDIDDQLRVLYGRPGLQRLADHVQDDEDVFRLLEYVRESISDYKVRLRSKRPYQY